MSPWASMMASYFVFWSCFLVVGHSLMACSGCLRQRLMAMGMVVFTLGCQLAISENDSSITQSTFRFFMCCCASVKAGNVWMMSPSDEVLISRIFMGSDF